MYHDILRTDYAAFGEEEGILQISKASSTKRGLIALAAIASLVLGTAGPASAEEIIAGAGGGTGWEYPDDNDPDEFETCGDNFFSDLLSGTEFVIEHVGTYDGIDTSTQEVVSYDGPSTVTVNAEEHYISPLGTHDEDETDCQTPEEIPITATVHGSNLTGRVDCDSNVGTYIRVQSATRIEFTGSCTVTSYVVPASVTAETHHELLGTMTPCYIPPFGIPNAVCLINPNAGSFYEGTYVAESV